MNKYLLLTVSGLVLLAGSASAQTARPEPLQPRIDAGGKLGTDRSLGQMEGWMPLVQDDDSVLYGDIRWMTDSEENQEGNLGIGYRAIQGDHILGGHVWIDRRRTDRGSNFHQVTGGVEFLKEDWDIKANAYVPLNQEKEYTTNNTGNASPYMAGTGLFVDTNGTLVEEAQPGGDIEVGYRLPVLENKIDAVRIYGGGYAFIGDRSDDVIGGRVRTSVDITPLVNMGARYQYDEPRGSQAFLELTLRFPVAAKKRFQQHGLRARLDESPERDVDIVTGAVVTDSGLRKEVINTESGATQRVIHVDNTAAGGGNGSIENPYNTLAAAQAAMLDHDVVYVHAGNGTSSGMNQGIVINKNNVQLVGSGTDFLFDTGKFATRRPGITPANGTVIAAAGAAPVITNNQALSDAVLVTADDAVITGITVTGATRDGIRILADNKHFNSATVRNVTADGNTGVGIMAFANNGGTIQSVSITDNTTTNSTGGSSGAFDTGIRGRGIWVLSNGSGSHIEESIIDNNMTSGNSLEGITAQGLNNGSHGTISITNNNAQNSGTGVLTPSGIAISLTTGASADTITISHNISNNAKGAGIITTVSSASVDTITIHDNTSQNNASSGINMGVTDGTVNAINITENTVDHNVGVGLSAINSGSGNVGLMQIADNIVTDNGRQGVLLQATNTISQSISLSGNTFTGNGTASANPNFYYGVTINNDGTGTFNVDLGGGSLGSTGGNRIYNNFYSDIFIDSRPGTAAATPGTTISAQYNWWGVNTGLNQGTRATFDNGSASPGSSINATNHLTVDPGI